MTANLVEKRPELKRSLSAWISGICILGLAALPSFSGTLFGNFRLYGRSFIETVDSFLINGLLPIAGLGMVIIALLAISEADRKKLSVKVGSTTSYSMYSHWRFSLTWLVPIVIIVGLVLQLLGLIF